MIVTHIHLIAGQLQIVYAYLLHTEIVTCYQNLSVLSACLFVLHKQYVLGEHIYINTSKKDYVLFFSVV